MAGHPDPSLGRLNETIQRIRHDVAGASGVNLTIHSYLEQELPGHWCFIVTMSEQSAPPEYAPGPQDDLSGAGAAVPIETDWFDDTTLTLAVTVLEAVQLARWHHGLDPTWPPCPVHDDRHPLTVNIDPTDGRTKWLCAVSPSVPPNDWPMVGDLTHALIRWGAPMMPGTLTLDGEPLGPG